jgi:hypothetical protein
MRVLRKLKRILENIRADVDRVLSNGLGLKPKSCCGLKRMAGFKWKKVRPFHLGADSELRITSVRRWCKPPLFCPPISI